MEKLFSDILNLDSPEEALKKLNEEIAKAPTGQYPVQFQKVSLDSIHNEINARIVHIFKEEHQSTSVCGQYIEGKYYELPFNTKTEAHYALIAVDNNAVLTKFLNQLSNAVKEARGLRAEIEDMSKKLVDAIESTKTAQKRTEELSLSLAEQCTVTGQYRDIIKLLEGDISKIKSAIGEIRFNEITGEK